MEIDCKYALKLLKGKNGKQEIRCTASRDLGDKRDTYNPINSKNPEDPKELILCILPKNPGDPTVCPVKEYYESRVFQENDGLLVLHNYLKQFGY